MSDNTEKAARSHSQVVVDVAVLFASYQQAGVGVSRLLESAASINYTPSFIMAQKSPLTHQQWQIKHKVASTCKMKILKGKCGFV